MRPCPLFRHRIVLIAFITALFFSGNVWGGTAGDFDGSDKVDLKDVLIGLQISSGMSPDTKVFPKNEISGDASIGMEDVIYDFQVVAGTREEAPIWYKDEDGDGYSDGTRVISVEQPDANYFREPDVFWAGDADDTDPDVTVDAPQVLYSQVPKELQLYPRDSQNESDVIISGALKTSGYEFIVIKTYQNNLIWQEIRQRLVYGADRAPFDIEIDIPSGLLEYRFEIFFDTYGGERFKERAVDRVVSGDVFLVNGQSNAVTYYPTITGEWSEWVRSYGSSTRNPITCREDTEWYIANSTDKYESGSIGKWAMHLAKNLVDSYDIPICILNGAEDGREIDKFQRLDSNHDDLSRNYGRLLFRAQQAGVAEHVKAILWHQGESDKSEPRCFEYADRFDSLYHDWKENYPGVEKIYTFQVAFSCADVGNNSLIRETQRNIPQNYSDIELMATVGLSGYEGCHYSVDGYNQMAEWIFRPVARDLYGEEYDFPVDPPNLLGAYFTCPQRTEVKLVFDQPIVTTYQKVVNGNTHYLKDYFYLDNEWGSISSFTYSDIIILLDLTEETEATTISYLPDYSYHNSNQFYDGPWIRGEENEVGALAFYEVELQTSYTIDPISQTFGNAGGEGEIAISNAGGCDWSVTSNHSWITITSVDDSGAGTISVSYEVDAYMESGERVGTIDLSGETFTVTQSGCEIALSPLNQTFDVEGGEGTAIVSAPSECSWTAVSNDSWITISSGNSGTGDGETTYAVGENTGSFREGTISVAGQTLTISQQGTDVELVLSSASVTVPEGNTATFSIKLSAQIDQAIAVSVVHQSGDSDISVQSGATLEFTSSNWSIYQTVTLAAAEDADNVNGTASILVSADGMTPKTVTATEEEMINDTLIWDVGKWDEKNWN